MVQLPAIVDEAWLNERLAANDNPELVVVDVRSYLDGRVGRDAYLADHLPGAVFVDLDEVLAAPASPAEGRHPLPTPEVFAAGLGAAGIAPDSPVVAYDDLGGMIAGRLVWMLRIIGAPAALLDGGITGWHGATEAGEVTREPVDRPAVDWPTEALASIDEVEASIRAGGLVVDSRAGERYRGEAEPIDPRAGHVPGAVNAPFTDNLTTDASKAFRPLHELRDRFAALGADGETIFYCGSGVSACNNVLAMEAAGHDRPRVYVGSWSQWSNDPDRPAATGEAS
ncbi:MAG: sulfurtransferase [Acidimicrobiales bacterium]